MQWNSANGLTRLIRDMAKSNSLRPSALIFRSVGQGGNPTRESFLEGSLVGQWTLGKINDRQRT
jgi:hypothetical protein